MRATLSLPFRFYNGGVAASYDIRETWKDRVFVAVTTSYNERVMNPNYGSQISLAVFEPYNMAKDLITSSVSKAFRTWLPQLELNAVTIEPDQGDGSINISVNYTLPNAEEDTLKLKKATFNRYGELVRSVI